jgi:hypothetical protein
MNPSITAPKLLETASFQVVSALAIYTTLSIYCFGIPIIFHPSTLYVGVSGTDPTIFMWCLTWWPHAIMNHSNPFITHVIWAPSGYNLAWATSIPGPSLLAWPLTRRFGPVVAYNVLCLLGPASAAWATFLLCRYIARHFWPAILGGYVFGFSPYIVGQMRGHLFLLMVFPIPILVLLVLMSIRRATSKSTTTIALTLLLTFEFLCSTEIFATMSIVGTLVIASALVIYPSDRKSAIWSGILPLGYAYVAAILLLAPYIYWVFARGEPPPINSARTYSADLLNFLLPTKLTLISLNPFLKLSARFTGNLSENTAYFGPPLLVMFLVFAISYWHESAARLLILSLFSVCLISLGPALHILGQPTISLPWTVASYLPLIDQALPVRFSLYSFLIAAVITALYLNDPKQGYTARCVLGSLIFLFSVPSVGYFRSENVSKVDTPVFFSTEIYRSYLRRDDTVLVLPFAYLGNSMLWQAQTEMYFRMAEGHIDGEPPRDFLAWPVVEDLLTNKIGTDFAAQLKAFLGAKQINAIVVDQRYREVWTQLSPALGVLSIATGGVSFYSIPPNILVTYRNSDPTVWAQRRAFVQFSRLIGSAARYVSANLPLSGLTPSEADRVEPSEKGLSAETKQNSTNANWRNGLWLGAYGNGIGVGIVGSYVTVRPIIERFGPYAEEIYFPYPQRLVPSLGSETYGQLLLVVDPRQLNNIANTIQPDVSKQSGATLTK